MAFDVWVTFLQSLELFKLLYVELDWILKIIEYVEISIWVSVT